MLLFKEYHVKPILEDRKKETRRNWKRKRCNVGALHQAKTKMLSKEHFAKLLIKNVWQEKLGDISEESADLEGGYTQKEYRVIWKDINGWYDPDKVLWAVRFDRVIE